MVDYDGQYLHLGAERLPSHGVRGFVERYSPWSGRAWTEVDGARHRLAIGSDYAAIRRRLREWFPDRPFQSDWEDGRFPSAPGGLPADLITIAGVTAGGFACGAIGWHLGPTWGTAAAILLSWPLVRLRDRVEVGPRGIKIGPWWTPRVPWHSAGTVRFRVSGRQVSVWIEGPSVRGGPATVPAILLPALRARVRRLGGVELTRAGPEVETRYARWRAPAAGIPWGVLTGTTVAAPWASDPWTCLLCGLLVAACTGLFGAAVEARAGGWGAGAVFWLTGAYAVVLAAVTLGLWSS